MNVSSVIRCLFALAIFGLQIEVMADTFGSGDNVFEIDFVSVGSPGNQPDPNGFPRAANFNTGSVAYEFRMAKHEISEDMIRKANAISSDSGSPLDVTLGFRGADKPATGISWYEAALFANWLNESSGFSPAYKFIESNPNDETRGFSLWEEDDPGYDAENPFRNSNARYVIPSLNEGYKAAYFDPATDSFFLYPTGSDTLPQPIESGVAANTAVFLLDGSTGPADIHQAGGLSPFGTMGQGGNVREWLESTADLVTDDPFELRLRRGDWRSFAHRISAEHANRFSPTAELSSQGFRVASVPEPGCTVFFVWAVLPWMVLRSSRSRRLNPANRHRKVPGGLAREVTTNAWVPLLR